MQKIIESISQFVDLFYNFKIDDQIAYKTLRDSLSTGQIQSKLRIIKLCHELNIKSKKSVFIGHWHGLLPLMMKNEIFLETAIGIEKSATWSEFSNSLNNSWHWKSYCSDIHDYKIEIDTDLVVNTSCEHMDNRWLSGIPKGCYVILQSTDFEHEEHANTHPNIDSFSSSLQGINIIVADTLDCKIYKRFTIFGQKK